MILDTEEMKYEEDEELSHDQISVQKAKGSYEGDFQDVQSEQL